MLLKSIKNRIDNIARPLVVKCSNHFQVDIPEPISIIASNCNGGVLCKDLGIQFASPFVNLWIEPKDFIRLLIELKSYMKLDLNFTHEKNVKYPVGLLGDIKLYFMHYSTEEEAYESWYRRRDRINYNNIYVMFTDRDGCTYDDLLKFDQLDYKKVVFTSQVYTDIQSSFCIEHFKGCKEVGILTEYVPTKLGVRYYDEFDFKKWIEG